jgi:pimeloyl-ACP methyl ester carboxylesterase
MPLPACSKSDQKAQKASHNAYRVRALNARIVHALNHPSKQLQKCTDTVPLQVSAYFKSNCSTSRHRTQLSRSVQQRTLYLLRMASFPSARLAIAAPDMLLPYQSLNENSDSSILFIHGAFTDGNDWNLVVPHMRNYHLLLPDTPGHGQASHLPFSIKSSAEHIARLIAAKAIDGRAHIVGHSLGASIAILLAIEYPDVVLATFVSGYSDMPLSRTPLLPYLFWASNRIENAVPRPIVRWLMDGADMRRTSGSRMSLCTDIAHIEKVKLRPWASRTLIVVAGKGGLVPSNDNADAARSLATVGREGNAKTTAVTHPAMRHPWNRQNPRLWAEIVESWVEERSLPTCFVPI